MNRHSTGHWTSTLLDTIENGFAYLSGLIFVFLALATSYDVMMRKWTVYSAPWVVELSEVAVVYATFLSAAWIMRLRGHVSLDTVVNKVSVEFRQILTIVTMAIAVVGWAIMTWFSLILVNDAFDRGLTIDNFLSIPRWIALLPIPIGSFLMACECLRQFLGARGKDEVA